LLPPIVAGAMWKFIYYPELVILTYLLQVFGLEKVDLLGNPSYALLSIIAVDIWMWTPYSFLIFLAGFESIDPVLYEAAAIDGANSLETLIFIKLPFLKPLFLVIIMFRFVWSFRIFDIIYALTQGGPGVSTVTLSVYIYETAFRALQIGKASALSFIMLIISLLIVSPLIWEFIKNVKSDVK